MPRLCVHIAPPKANEFAAYNVFYGVWMLALNLKPDNKTQTILSSLNKSIEYNLHAFLQFGGEIDLSNFGEDSFTVPVNFPILNELFCSHILSYLILSYLVHLFLFLSLTVFFFHIDLWPIPFWPYDIFSYLFLLLIPTIYLVKAVKTFHIILTLQYYLWKFIYFLRA